MLKNKVLKTIRRYNLINKGEHVVLGLSGGPDSVCLFHILRELAGEIGFSLAAVHVNHMMRSETNYRDEKFVEKLCGEYDIPLHVFHKDCREIARACGISAEEAGRNARYDAFARTADIVVSEGEGAAIAVAHNGDDQAETLIYRILRGTGTDGLAGMEHAREHGRHRVIRPLLDASREEIEQYCREHNLEYVIDETNEQPIYTRNRIRLELLPYLRENYNENIAGALRRLADIAACDRDYMWEQAESAYESVILQSSDDTAVFDRQGLAGLHEALRHRVILKGLGNIGLVSDVSHERLKAADEIIAGSSETKVVELPHGYRVTAAYDRVYLRKEKDISANDREIQVTIADISHESDNKENGIGEKDVRRPNDMDGDIVLDADKAAAEAGIDIADLSSWVAIRNRRPGDYIPLNGGSKSVRKLMGEMKIPADLRYTLPLVAAGSCILFIEAHDGRRRYAETLRATVDSKHLLIVKFV